MSVCVCEQEEEARAWNIVRSDVDDHCPLLDPFALDEESFTDRRDENIRSSNLIK